MYGSLLKVDLCVVGNKLKSSRFAYAVASHNRVSPWG